MESLGLLKIDFLGLRNLTVLGNILNLICEQGIKIDPNEIPLDDSETLQLFQEGKLMLFSNLNLVELGKFYANCILIILKIWWL